MLAKNIFILLSTCIATVMTELEYEEYNNNGWIPINKERVYNQFKQEFSQTPEHLKADDTNGDIDLIKQEAIKFVATEGKARNGRDYLNPIVYEKVQYIDNYVKCKNIGNHLQKYYFKIANKINRKLPLVYVINLSGTSICPDIINEENIKANERNYYLPISSKISPTNQRRAKGIYNYNRKKDFDLVPENNKPIINDKYNEDFVVKETIPIEDEEHTYKVTEDGESTEAEPSESNEKPGYTNPFYKVNVDTNNASLTGGLLNILSKYNINANDNLQNYALSRVIKNQSPSKPFNVYQPDKLMIPYGYNSLDHLPVDPLLAVLLSNYGHYLPGIYGINNNYNNLYGYLASNNIHNNMPFGLYKIFSDTDSSN